MNSAQPSIKLLLERATEQSIMLERIHFQSGKRFNSEIVRHCRASFENILDDEFYDMLMKIDAAFYAKKYDIPLDFGPATWWDHFKQDAIPTITRLLRLKVIRVKRTLMAATVFPEIDVPIPGDRLYYHEIGPLSSYNSTDES